MLLAVVVAIFLVLLALSVAAPKVAEDLRRDREVEAIHRGNEYVRAIRLYYLKFGRYPPSMDALEKSNNTRFLRQQYVDPMTGKADWKLIHIGEAKTTVKGFFGQPLAGLPNSSGGLGSAQSMSSNIGTPNSPTGASSPSSASSSSSSSLGLNFGSSSSGSPSPGGSSSPNGSSLSGTAGATPGSNSSSSMGGMSSQSASSFSGGGAPFVGVGIPKNGGSITILNEQTTYATWEFIYDPRIEQMKAKAALLGGSPANSGGLPGTSPNGFGSPPGTTTPSNTPSTPTSPVGTPVQQ